MVLSHLACFVLPALDRPVFLSDAAINIAPSIDDKMKIIQNGVDFLHRIGWCEPIVGLLAAVEKVNPKMPATTDAKEIVERQKQFVIKGCQIGKVRTRQCLIPGDGQAQGDDRSSGRLCRSLDCAGYRSR